MTGPKIRIAISPTAIKVAAAKIAIERARADLGLDIELVESQFKSPSGIPEQPVDLVEAHNGAFNRASAVLGAPDATDATHGLGVENAAVYVGRGKWADPAVISLFGRDGTETVAVSVGIPMPSVDLGKAIAANQDKTAGSFIAKRVGCDGSDWHHHMSDGHLSRMQILADAIYAVLVQVRL